MLVLENISCAITVVREGGKSSQMTLMKHLVILHKRNLVHKSAWLSSQDTSICKRMIISDFGAIKLSSQRSTSHDKNCILHSMYRDPGVSSEDQEITAGGFDSTQAH